MREVRQHLRPLCARSAPATCRAGATRVDRRPDAVVSLSTPRRATFSTLHLLFLLFVCVCGGVFIDVSRRGGLLLCVCVCVKEILGQLQPERYLHAQLPCLGDYSTQMEALLCRRQSFQSGTFLIPCYSPPKIHFFISGTNKHVRKWKIFSFLFLFH